MLLYQMWFWNMQHSQGCLGLYTGKPPTLFPSVFPISYLPTQSQEQALNSGNLVGTGAQGFCLHKEEKVVYIHVMATSCTEPAEVGNRMFMWTAAHSCRTRLSLLLAQPCCHSTGPWPQGLFPRNQNLLTSEHRNRLAQDACPLWVL